MFKKVCPFIFYYLFQILPLPVAAGIENLTDRLLQERWVDSVYQVLDQQARIGQLIMIPAYSGRDEYHYREVERLVVEEGIGGLIFYQGGPVRQSILINRYQSAAKIPLLLGMESVSGLNLPLDSLPVFPDPVTLGAIGNEDYLYNLGAEMARQFRYLGLHFWINSLADTGSEQNNFGDQFEKVTSHYAAIMKGFQDNQLMMVAKGFPGKGIAGDKTGNLLPGLNKSVQQLEGNQFMPYQVLAVNGLEGMMPTHTTLPSLTGVPDQSASLSGKTMDYLRQNLKFNGLIFSDALNYQVIARSNQPGETAFLALKAGNDVLVAPKDVEAAKERLSRAIQNGEISNVELERKVKKILNAKYEAGLARPGIPDPGNIIASLNNQSAKLIRQQLLEQSVTVLKNEAGLIPFRQLDTVYFASLELGIPDASVFENSLQKYTRVAPYFLNPISFGNSLLDNLERYDVVILALRQENLNAAADKPYLEFLKELEERTNLVVVLFGSPADFPEVVNFKNALLTYQEDPELESLATQVLFGAQVASGRLPFNLNHEWQAGSGETTDYLGRLGYSLPEGVGMDAYQLQRIDRIMEWGIKEEAFPGGQVLVARKGKIVYEKGFGYQTYAKKDPVSTETVYDLASITKVASTLQATMFAVDRGMIAVEENAAKYLPELKNTNKGGLILKDVLTHQAGLLPFLSHWRHTVDDFGLQNTYYSIHPDHEHPLEVAEGLYAGLNLRDSVWNWTIRSDLRRKRRTSDPYDYKYSDLGFYLMQSIMERVLNQPLDDFVDQNFYQPLGLSKLTYRPLCKYPAEVIAPTESDSYFRLQLVRGFVHDPGAAMFGGVAGHAGLFSNAFDLACLMQMNLQGGYYGGIQYLQPETIRRFTTQVYPKNRRGLGWDKPSWNEEFNVTSPYASASTFGHTGFTGTAVWVDPQFDLIYIFLSNRVYPDAGNAKLIKYNIRTKVHNQIYKAIFEYSKYQ
jgi:CubicO group peptidase (beta-lactamase class C family)/beta-glucosidase-like glycosyl hydrolase